MKLFTSIALVPSTYWCQVPEPSTSTMHHYQISVTSTSIPSASTRCQYSIPRTKNQHQHTIANQ